MYQPLFAQDQLMAEVEEDIEVAKLPMFCCFSDILRPLNIVGDWSAWGKWRRGKRISNPSDSITTNHSCSGECQAYGIWQNYDDGDGDDNGDDNDFDDDIDVGDGVQLYRILWYYDDKAVPDNDDDDGGVDDANYGDDDDDDDDIGNDDNLEKCLKEPELASREDPKKEDDLDNLSKEENLDNISERENVENESRSVKLGAFNENPAPALPQQQPSIDQNVQVINT